MTSIITSITPVSYLAMLLKAEPDKSTIRPFTNGPLSLLITMTLLPFFVLVIVDLDRGLSGGIRPYSHLFVVDLKNGHDYRVDWSHESPF